MPVVSFNSKATAEPVTALEVQKADYKVEFPMAKHRTKGAGVKLVLQTLMTARDDVRVHPISSLDDDLVQIDQLPAEDSEDWNKYIFNDSVKKTYGQNGKEDFYVCHVAVSTVHRLAELKAIDEVQMVLTAERIYVRARNFTSSSKKVPIGWLSGPDVAFSDKKSIEDDITEHLSSAGSESIVDPKIQLNVQRIHWRLKKEAFSTKAWMVYANSTEANSIQKVIQAYLESDEKKYMGLRGTKFVPYGGLASAVKALRIKEHNKALCSTAVVAIDNIYPSGVVKPSKELEEWFDFLPSQDEQIEWKQLIDENFDTWMGGMQDTATEFVKDIIFKSGKLCVVCDIKHAQDVVDALKVMTEKINSSLSSEQIAEMCGIYGYTPSKSPRVDQIWQYSQSGIKKTPVDIYIPEDLKAEDVQQFMTDMGMYPTALEAYEPSTYAISPPATFSRREKTPVQLDGPQASSNFWSKYRQQRMEAPSQEKHTPPRSSPKARHARQGSPTTIIEAAPHNNSSVSKAVENDLLQRLRDQEQRMNDLQQKMSADLEEHRKQTEAKFEQMDKAIEAMSNNTDTILKQMSDTAETRNQFEENMTNQMTTFMKTLTAMQDSQSQLLDRLKLSPARKKANTSIDVANNLDDIHTNDTPLDGPPHLNRMDIEGGGC